MTFAIKQRFGFKYLIHSSTLVSYGLFFGDLDLDHLNNIYKTIEKETKGIDYDTLEKDLKETIDYILKSSFVDDEDKKYANDFITSLDNPLSKELSLYKFYLTQIASTALSAYCLNVIKEGLPKVWFKNFIPKIRVTQLNNNPYSNINPLYDSSIKWKIELYSMCKRDCKHLFNRYLAEYIFI